MVENIKFGKSQHLHLLLSLEVLLQSRSALRQTVARGVHRNKYEKTTRLHVGVNLGRILNVRP